MSHPYVTVLMPVYNGEKYLSYAIESILNQSYKNFEFLIIDDGSTDDSVEIIKSYSDKRIKLIQNSKNLKLIKTLNYGFSLAKGKYVVRMDCDDISYLNRLKIQVDFMNKNQNIFVSGTWLQFLNENGDVLGIWTYPIESEKIRAELLFDSPFAHPSVIIRKKAFDEINIKYSEQDIYAEDFGLWQNLSDKVEFSNIPQILLKYRLSNSNTSLIHKKQQKKSIKNIYARSLKQFGLTPSENHLSIHYTITRSKEIKSYGMFRNCFIYFNLLYKLNEENEYYDKTVFSEILGKYLFLTCLKSSSIGLTIIFIYFKSNIFLINNLPLKTKAKRFFIFFSKLLSRMILKPKYIDLKNPRKRSFLKKNWSRLIRSRV